MPLNPEYRGGRGPEPGGRQPEGQPLPYYLAARFPTKQTAEQPYTQTQETIRTMDYDLSAYRFLVPQQLTAPRHCYVAVIGKHPPEAIHQEIKRTVSPMRRHRNSQE